MIKGKVKWFKDSKGYGFITPDPDQGYDSDIFVHYTEIVGAGFKTLVEDTRVMFDVNEVKGKLGGNGLVARNVKKEGDTQ